MRIAFISDLHGSLFFLEKVMQKIDILNPELIVFSGDLLYHGPRNELPYGYNPKKCAEIINNIDIFAAVRGNCDSEVDQMMIKHPLMNDYISVFDGKRRFFITHGHVYSKDNHPYLPCGSIFVSGHTHVPFCEKSNEIIYFNPGSISLPKNGTLNSFGFYDENSLSVISLEGEIIKLMKVL